MPPPPKASPWDLRANVPESTLIPPGRRYVASGEARFAHALIEGALVELRSSHEDIRRQAKAWFEERESPRIASLGWCCSVLSFTLGEVISAPRMAKAALLWEPPTPKARPGVRIRIHQIRR